MKRFINILIPSISSWNILLIIIVSSFALPISKGNAQVPARQDTLKGSITEERAWWNVLHYDLTIQPDFKTKTLWGKNIIEFERNGNNADSIMQIDLQAPLQIDSVVFETQKLSYKREGAAWFIQVPTLEKDQNSLSVFYSGTPKESFNPPYDGGIVWEEDSLGRPWISVACQLVGGSIWYPCKDHFSEEPDHGATITIIVPSSLVAIGNGRLVKTVPEKERTRYTWKVVNPINNYGLTFYIGNYVNITKTFKGVAGGLDMTFWVLDYNLQKAEDHMIPEVLKTMEAFEYWFGPYPFYEDGFQMVESSYIGMEHQSAVAYGNQFRKGRLGFNNLTKLDYYTDRLIVHEMAHEWFGNNITMSDMADRWVQEGFAALGEELMIEYHFGRTVGREFFLSRSRNKIRNEYPLISRYGIFEDAGPDMYYKGWAIMHMIREIMDDDSKFRNMLIAMNENFHLKTISSSELEAFISKYSGFDFHPFFDQYLRQAAVPVMEYSWNNDSLRFRIKAEQEDIIMPVRIIDPNEVRINVSSKWNELALNPISSTDTFAIDPNWLLEIRKVKLNAVDER